MRLNELLLEVGKFDLVGNENLEIAGVQYDSRKVKPGDCFVCIRGFQTDGRLFAAAAVEAGAVALVYDECDENIETLLAQGVTGVLVPETRFVLGYMSSCYYEKPSEHMIMVGVTGTNGKTSITHLVADMFEQMGKKMAVFGTIENRVADEIIPATVTTPESLELNEMLALARSKEVYCCAMEVSSHAVALQRVSGLAFDYGIFTNLTKDHLDFHKTMEAYFEAKKVFFNFPQKGLIINNDDPYGKVLEKHHRAGDVPVVTYGVDGNADLKACDLKMTGQGTEFSLNWQGQVYNASVPIPGKIYVYNILAAMAVLIMEGCPVQEVIAYAAKVKPLRGRLEPVQNTLGITVLIDYAHTPDGLENAIKSARIFTSGRLVTVFGCGGDRDKTKRPQMGNVASKLSDYTIVTSDNPRTEDPKAIIEDILPGISGAHEIEFDRALAIVKALEWANKGDTVLIAGKGHETYQIVGTVKNHFDDREEVERWLLEANK